MDLGSVFQAVFFSFLGLVVALALGLAVAVVAGLAFKTLRSWRLADTGIGRFWVVGRF